MTSFNISGVVPVDSKKEILKRVMDQAGAEVFRIAIEMVLDPDTITAEWRASDLGLDENNFLWSSALSLEFHVKRFHAAKTQLEAMSSAGE